MTTLQSYLAGRWQSGAGEGTALVNPTTEEVLAHASSSGLDLGEAVRHGRELGGPALRAMSFAQRAESLRAVAAAVHEQREALIELGVRNAGNTRGDAKFDIDGATATLTAYAGFAAALPDTPFLPDGEGEALGRSPRFQGRHVWVSRRGLGVHINAFNFPAWGMLEKLACSLLAGVPVLEKPGTPTAMMAEAIAHIIIERELLPEGAFQFLAGSAGDLLDHLGPQDNVAFTGSSSTGQLLRRHAAFVERGARLNVEADSLNATVLGPDLQDDTAGFDAFVRDTAREVTQKAGQKCTATRRILVPAERAEEVAEALAEAFGNVKVGDPSERETRMGPLTTAGQLDEVQAGIARLAEAARTVIGGPERTTETGYFVAPTLLLANHSSDAVFHGEEVFAPVASVLPYDGTPGHAAELVARGSGALVSSVFSDDKEFLVTLGHELAPWSGRLYMSGSRVAEYGTGPGLVLPSLVHGGPGRAGGGEELGGLRGLQFSMQRTAIQGFKTFVESGFAADRPD